MTATRAANKRSTCAQPEERSWVLRCGASDVVLHLIVRARDPEAAKAAVLGQGCSAQWDEPIDTVFSVRPMDGAAIATVSVLCDGEWM